MKVVINMELDYVQDRDVLFFLSNEKLVTKCIKNMSIKKDKTDKVDENQFNVIMNKGLTSETEEIVDTEYTDEDKSDDSDDSLYIK